MTTLHEDQGEAWVAAQLGIFALIIAAPRWEGAWPPATRRLGRTVGLPVVLVGAALLVAGSWQLGRHLTPLPRPTAHTVLVRDGVYGVIRHPIYGGLVLLMLGGALSTGRLARLVIALAAIGFFDAKARREEVWLVERFPDYAGYRLHVYKLIPGLY